MLESDISYGYAHLFLKPKEEYGGDFDDVFSEGVKFSDSINRVNLLVDEKYILEMHGISIPLSKLGKLSSKELIVDSVKKLIGNFDGKLERCVELVNRGIIQDNFSFSNDGLYDYSRKNTLHGRSVTDWVWVAKNYLSKLNELSSCYSMKMPKNAEVRVLPTFENISAVDGLGKEYEMHPKEENKRFFIEGETFAGCVMNFLNMYDAVDSHLEWLRIKERENMLSGSSEKVYLSELVVPNS